MLKKKMKKERIYTVKNTNDFIHNCNEETKLSFNLPPDMICQIINYGNLCKDSFKEYMLADTRKEIAIKIHDYWKYHSEILYPRSSRSYMWLYYNEINRKRLRTLQEENIKQLSYMIYMMTNKERRNGKMINTIVKTDNTDKKKRQMKDQKRKEMSVSEHGIFSLSKRQRPKQKIGREYLYSRVLYR